MADRSGRMGGAFFDAGLALVLTGASQAEVWTTASGSRALRAPVAALMTISLVWRRRAPLAVLLVVMGSALAQSVIDPDADVGAVLVVAIIVAAYSVAAHEELRRAAVGGGLGLAALLGSTGAEGGGLENYLFAGSIFVAAWIAGRGLRERRGRVGALEELAAALEQNRDELARAAVAEERSRIARDLHDVVAHSMSVIVVQAGAERLALPDETETTREVLRSIEHTGRQALVEMRRLVEMLRRDDEELALAPEPSLAHLALLAEQVREAGLPVDLRVEGDPVGLPPGVDLSAYRIVQEALTNALKHAGPARARVTVRYGGDRLEIEVADDGAGSAGTVSGGHGLVGMRERVAVVGGSLQAGRRPDGGYAVHAILPFESALG